MSSNDSFVAQAKKNLDSLGAELDHLEGQIRTEHANASAWYKEQMARLRGEWRDAHSKIETMARDSNAKAEASYNAAKDDVERHWSALQAAVRTYRQHVESGTQGS